MGAAFVVSLAPALALGVIVLRLRLRLHAQRRLLREYRATMQERTDRVAVLSHELRTPLTLILGPVELLLEESPGPLTGAQREFLATVRNNAQRLQDLAEIILTHGRIEAGMFRMEPGEVDLRSLGLQVVHELRTMHDLPIALDCPGMPPVVHGDRTLLVQAVTNLLTNACRHAGGGEVVLRIQQQTRKTLVSVEDRGVGMSRDARREAVRRYRTTGSGGSHGLGLVITKEIVRLHGGTLHIQSTPSAGTIMLFGLENVEPRG